MESLPEMSMLLSLATRFVGNVYIVRCTGRVILGEEVKALENALDAAAREFTRFVVDLGEVSRLDSIAMGLLVRHAERMNKLGGGMRLAAAPAFVTNLLHMTRLSNLLPSYATEEEAIVSFLKERPAQGPGERNGPRVLVVDESPDLCVFVRTVLARHGFDVRSTTSLRDAKILLNTNGAEYILVGPGTPQMPADTVVRSLTALVPGAKAMALAADFKIQDAEEATFALLQMFRVSGSS
jgi:anti-anti-sigma factor